MTTPLGLSLEQPSPPVTTAQAAELAGSYFGLHGSIAPLAGERDRNFKICEPDGVTWVLKVGHPADSAALSDLQSSALLQVAAADPELPVPRVRKALDGSTEILWTPPAADIQAPCRVRVYSYVPGVPLHTVPASARLRGELGGVLGRLDRALSGFDHPAARHDLIWDASRVTRIADLVDPGDTEVRAALDHVAEHTLPRLVRVRHQMIHNDANPHNVMTEATGRDIVGLIDFGDIVRAPLPQEIATAAAYQLADGSQGLDACLDLVRAYHVLHPLTEEEATTVFDLMVARLILIVVITGWRAERHPHNRDYILRNQHRARLGLERALSVECDEANATILQALETSR
ncbi:phosphotransferase [Streptomyces plumbiresistens]|uniref:Hydroxylysine kinase n=1 Tax=Streptomyces plumbiresistens TaxID=511811 RepID=A0ABP7SM64_9ACTN